MLSEDAPHTLCQLAGLRCQGLALPTAGAAMPTFSAPSAMRVAASELRSRIRGGRVRHRHRHLLLLTSVLPATQTTVPHCGPDRPWRELTLPQGHARLAVVWARGTERRVELASHHVVRFAVVGVEGYSRSHLRMVASLAGAGRGRLVASMIINQDDHPDIVSEFEQRKVRVFGDYAVMLEACRGEVDVVTLPVPIYLHAPMTVAALRAGYHVLVEKPVAGSVAEADDMVAAWRASDRHCAVGFQQIYSPVFQTLKERIAAGRLGRVRRIAIAALWPRPQAYYDRNEWAGKLFCGGHPVYDSPFNNALAHQIMNMLYLASPQREQAASVQHVEAELYRAYDIESFDTGCMRARTSDGVQLVFAATHACSETMNPVMRLDADAAHVDWEIGGDATIRYGDGTAELIPERAPHLCMIENIADAVLGRVPQPDCTLEIGRAHAACIDAVHRAAQTRDVLATYVSVSDDGQRLVSGVEDAVRAVWSTGQLFSELRTPFARESQ